MSGKFFQVSTQVCAFDSEWIRFNFLTSHNEFLSDDNAFSEYPRIGNKTCERILQYDQSESFECIGKRRRFSILSLSNSMLFVFKRDRRSFKNSCSTHKYAVI